MPLKDHDEQRILDKFTSVTRATLKGTLMIGVLQGGMAGLAFAFLGIPSTVFWGTIMAILSVIPSIGSALVWVPTAIYLAITGHLAKGIGLFIFCGAVVGSLDNLLRPILVGKDTQMHELMIFFRHYRWNYHVWCDRHDYWADYRRTLCNRMGNVWYCISGCFAKGGDVFSRGRIRKRTRKNNSEIR